MAQKSPTTQAAGAALSVGAVLMVSALVIHGPIDPDPADMMTAIAGRILQWQVAHWLAAAGLSSLAVAGLVALTDRTRLTQSAASLLAWAALTVGALWTVPTAVSEVTALAGSAIAGDEAQFLTWSSFAEAFANGFVVLALAVAVIAGREARIEARATPGWAAALAMFAGCASFAGWGLGMWAEVRIGNLIWLASSILMCLWLAWFGIGLTRAESAQAGNRHRVASGA